MEEETFVITTVFPMFLLFSSDNSDSISFKHLATLKRFCVRISTRFPRSEFYDLP